MRMDEGEGAGDDHHEEEEDDEGGDGSNPPPPPPPPPPGPPPSSAEVGGFSCLGCIVLQVDTPPQFGGRIGGQLTSSASKYTSGALALQYWYARWNSIVLIVLIVTFSRGVRITLFYSVPQ